MTYTTYTSSDNHPLSCRVLAVYISHGINKVLMPKQVWLLLSKTSNVKHESVRSAIQNLYRQRLLSKSNRAGYYMPDKKAADHYITKSLGMLGILPRWPPKASVEGWFDAGKWLDLAGAIVENARIPNFRVDSYDNNLIRVFLSKKSNVSKRDRAAWLSHVEPSFSMNITKKGSIMLILHSLDYVDNISRFLSECGLSDVRKHLFFDRFYSTCKNAKVSVEMNILANKKDLPQIFEAKTYFGDAMIRTRLNHSGGNAELEISGGLAPVHNFLNHLAGLQHNSASDYLQTKHLASIDSKFSLIVDALETFVKNYKYPDEVNESKKIQKKPETKNKDNIYQ